MFFTLISKFYYSVRELLTELHLFHETFPESPAKVISVLFASHIATSPVSGIL